MTFRSNLSIPSGYPTLHSIALVGILALGSFQATSSAQSTWTPRVSGTIEVLSGVAYGGSRWVAVGEMGTILTSLNASSWTSASSGTASNLRGIAYGANKFVAVGSNGTVLTSPSGTTWTARTSGTTTFLSGITFGNGLFVAVAAAGTGPKIITSPDGLTWTPAPITVTGTLQSVHFSNGIYIASGSDNTQASKKIYRSTDGTNWVPTTPSTPSANTYSSTTAFKGRYYTCGLFGALVSSATGETWMNESSGTVEILRSIAAGPEQLVVVGNTGTILTSQTGTDWVSRTSGTTASINGIGYGNGLFVAVGDPSPPGNSVILTSPAAIGLTLEEALDAPSLGWITSGTGIRWKGQTLVTHDSVDAAGVVGSNAGTSSVLESTVDGPSTLTYFWKVSAGAGDGLTLLIDGTPAGSISGETDWSSASHEIPHGTHTIRWNFNRGANPPSGQNGAWIDEVTVIPFDYSIENWLADHFNEQELALPEISGLGEDPEHDGIVTLLEYYFDLDPRAPDLNSPHLPVYSVELGQDGFRHFAVTFTRHSGRAPNIFAFLETSSSLVTKGWGSIDTTEEILSVDGELETVRILETAAYQSDFPTLFYRLFVTSL